MQHRVAVLQLRTYADAEEIPKLVPYRRGGCRYAPSFIDYITFIASAGIAQRLSAERVRDARRLTQPKQVKEPPASRKRSPG